MAEQNKAGRPKVLVRRHVIEVKKETREWIEDLIGTVTTRTIAGKAIEAGGRAARGFLSHPAGLIVIAGAWISLLIVFKPGALGAETEEREENGVVTTYLRSLPKNLFMDYARSIMVPIMGAAGVEKEDAEAAIGTLWDLAQNRVGKPIVGFLADLVGRLGPQRGP